MKPKLFLAGASLLLLVGATADTQRYRLDPKASDVSARVAFFALASKTAGFPKVTGSASIAGRDPETLQLDVRIDARALTAPDTVTLSRLKGEKFFWVEKHPEIRFRGTGLRMVSERRGTLGGQLTARGVTKPVTLAVTFDEAPAHASTASPLDITGTTEIDRRDFGMNSYKLIVGRKVDITIRARMVPE